MPLDHPEYTPGTIVRAFKTCSTGRRYIEGTAVIEDVVRNTDGTFLYAILQRLDEDHPARRCARADIQKV